MPVLDLQKLQKVCRLLRADILSATTAAHSGHTTSSLSGVELMATLLFGGFFRAKLDEPSFSNNDRLIFSKGHASPLFYALYSVAGKVSEQELMRLRQFESPLEGHPTMRFPYTEAATGSLGQGLSIGMGMALNAKLDKLPYKTYVLLGDSEMAEGSNWEAIQLAAYYKLNNLIGIIDVNRLGQRGETMYAHDIQAYEDRIRAFGWQTYLIRDGHDLNQVSSAFEFALQQTAKPTMIIAKTIKGKGCSIFENKEQWHSKQLSEEQLGVCLNEIGEIDHAIVGEVNQPEEIQPQISTGFFDAQSRFQFEHKNYSTKEAAGITARELGKTNSQIVVLDGEVSNSTHSDLFKAEFPDRFFEMFIAEQNMVGAALGFSRRGKIPFVFTFAAFFTRAFDQIRMSQYSDPNIKFIGSYAGVSLGKDGTSQMGLEDIAMFRAVQNCVVLQPSDAISTMKLMQQAAAHFGNVYFRTIREALPILYDQDDQFKIGGSRILKLSNRDRLTVIGSGITVHEALKAYEILAAEGIKIRILDLYSIQPIDVKMLVSLAFQTKALLVVEDHYVQGGVAEAVRSVVGKHAGKVHSLAVHKMPRSGTALELLHYEEIDADAIVKKVKELIGQ
ncbi:MAG: transketolase [Patescibacteria group bacterium]